MTLSLQKLLCDWQDIQYDKAYIAPPTPENFRYDLQAFSSISSEREKILQSLKPYIPANFNISRPNPAPLSKAIPPTEKTPLKAKAVKNPAIIEVRPSENLDASKEEAIKIAANQNTTEELIKAVCQFDTKSDIQKFAAKTVFFKGDPHADILIIGDIPSREDEATQGPFSHDNNRILSKSLEYLANNIIKKDPIKGIAYSNILFWRPMIPKISSLHYQICLPFLHRLITLMNPKKIILCGGLTAQTLLNVKGSLLSLRGTVHPLSLDGQDYECLVSLHPLKLHAPNAKKLLWQDLVNFLAS